MLAQRKFEDERLKNAKITAEWYMVFCYFWKKLEQWDETK